MTFKGRVMILYFGSLIVPVIFLSLIFTLIHSDGQILQSSAITSLCSAVIARPALRSLSLHLRYFFFLIYFFFFLDGIRKGVVWGKRVG